jgi:hypothetical protein
LSYHRKPSPIILDGSLHGLIYTFALENRPQPLILLGHLVIKDQRPCGASAPLFCYHKMLAFRIDRNYPSYVINNFGAPRQGSYLKPCLGFRPHWFTCPVPVGAFSWHRVCNTESVGGVSTGFTPKVCGSPHRFGKWLMGVFFFHCIDVTIYSILCNKEIQPSVN